MHAVVNHIPIRPGADWEKMIRLARDFTSATLPAHPAVIAMQAVKASEEEMILVIVFSDEASMASFSSTVAAPWFAENIRPFMGGPADRKTGELVLNYLA